MRKTGVHRENQWEVEQSRGYQIRRRRGPSKVGRYSWKLWRDPFLRGTVGSVLGTDRALGISVQSLALSRTNWCSRFQKANPLLPQQCEAPPIKRKSLPYSLHLASPCHLPCDTSRSLTSLEHCIMSSPGLSNTETTTCTAWSLT